MRRSVLDMVSLVYMFCLHYAPHVQHHEPLAARLYSQLEPLLLVNSRRTVQADTRVVFNFWQFLFESITQARKHQVYEKFNHWRVNIWYIEYIWSGMITHCSRCDILTRPSGAFGVYFVSDIRIKICRRRAYVHQLLGRLNYKHHHGKRRIGLLEWQGAGQAPSMRNVSGSFFVYYTTHPSEQ